MESYIYFRFLANTLDNVSDIFPYWWASNGDQPENKDDDTILCLFDLHLFDQRPWALLSKALICSAAWKLILLRLGNSPNILWWCWPTGAAVSNLKISDLLFAIVLLSHLVPKSSGFSFTVNPTLRKMKEKNKKALLTYRDLGGTVILTYHALYVVINSRKKRVKSMTVVVFYTALHSFCTGFNCYVSYSTRNPAEILAALSRNDPAAYSFGNWYRVNW